MVIEDMQYRLFADDGPAADVATWPAESDAERRARAVAQLEWLGVASLLYDDEEDAEY